MIPSILSSSLRVQAQRGISSFSQTPLLYLFSTHTTPPQPFDSQDFDDLFSSIEVLTEQNEQLQQQIKDLSSITKGILGWAILASIASVGAWFRFEMIFNPQFQQAVGDYIQGDGDCSIPQFSQKNKQTLDGSQNDVGGGIVVQMKQDSSFSQDS